jgi:hypothetical protein
MAYIFDYLCMFESKLKNNWRGLNQGAKWGSREKMKKITEVKSPLLLSLPGEIWIEKDSFVEK